MQLPYPKFKDALPWIIFISLLFFINYVNRAVLSPLLVFIEQDLQIDHAVATRMIFFQACGFSISMFISGFAISWIKPKTLVGLSPIGCGIVLIFMAHMQSVAGADILFASLGFMAGGYFTAAMALMGELVISQDWGKAITIHEFAPPISMIMAPVIAQSILNLGGSWRTVLIVTGCFSGVIGILFMLTAKVGVKKPPAPSLHNLKSLTSPALWMFTWLFALGVSGEFATYSVLPLHLVDERLMSPESANHLLALSRLGAPLGVILGGILAIRLGSRAVVRIFLVVHGLSLLAMGCSFFPLAMLGMFIQPLVTACVFPAIFTIFAETFELEQQPILLGITVPISSYIASGIMPAMLGLWGKYSTFSWGFCFMGLLYLGTMPFTRVLDKKGS